MARPGTTRIGDLAAKDLQFVFHPNTNLAAHHATGPLVLTRGEGVYVWDDRGERYIDGMAGLWCTTLGYGDEELARTAYEQIKKLSFSHLFTGKSHEPAILLAEKLAELAPFSGARVLFGTSGSDANDTQVKLIRYYNNAIGRPRKKKIIAHSRGYHGVTVAAAGLSGLPAFHTHFDLPLPGILHAEAPYTYRNAQPGESEEDYAARLADELDRLVMREDPESIAAFIAEPVMGVGGVLLPPATYFEKIGAVLAKHDILMIDDEVICGFGRTGNMWGADTFGMQPHSLSVAKALSSAYLPISAVVVADFLYRPMIATSGEVGLFGHGYTYSGHPVAAAVALRTLEIYEERKLYDRVRRVAPHFQARLAELAEHEVVGDARGVGLMGGCELVRDRATKQPFDAKLTIGAKCMELCQRRGLIVRSVGDVVVVCPPYIVTAPEVDEIFDRFRQGLDDTLDWAKRERLVA